MITIAKKCSVTGEIYSVTVPEFKYELYKRGHLIQNVFPELNEDQREFLISYLTPAEWDNIFNNEKS